MFTGIVEEVGEVVEVTREGDGGVVTVAARTVADDVVHGASIAVNGVCLTVTGWEDDGDRQRLRFDVMGETFDRTTVGGLAAGDPVDLERAVRADARLGGHVVQGHVDGTGTVLRRTPGSNWELVRFALPAELARYVAEKGSIAVEGVSLTVAAVGVEDGTDWFEVGLIPETLRATVLGTKAPGDAVNLEVDVLAKYTERLLQRDRA
jgi:riboflavin synthase